MATMRDVAKLAGVSHGTVSNVINGSPGVSLDKIERVQAAMRQLGYKQNSLAKIMRSRETDTSIHLILPNLENSLYCSIYKIISQHASEYGSHINLWLTEDKPFKEKQILSNAQAFNMANAIIVTCQPGNTELFNRLRDEGVRMLFLLRQVKGHRFLGLDMEPLMHFCIRSLAPACSNKIALISGPGEYSAELSCVNGYIHAFLDNGLQLRNEYIVSTRNTVEAYMYAATGLLSLPEPPSAIIIPDSCCAKGVRQAMAVADPSLRHLPRLVIFDGEGWPSAHPGETLYTLPAKQIADRAFEQMLEVISRKDADPPVSETIETPLPIPEVSISSGFSGDVIRVLLLNTTPSLVSTMSMIGDFARRTGIRAEFEMQPYSRMLETIETSGGDFDAMSIDLAWASELNIRGYVQQLDDYLPGSGISLNAFPEKILREYCYYDGHMYAVPYNYTTQLLLYRKDLFDSLKSKRHFYEITGKQLKVPTTWEEYNEVARFFTRSCNPESETLYGTTLGGCEYNGAALEYFPRMWGMAGCAIDGDWTDLQSENALKAFLNYVECFKYAPPEALDSWWDEEVKCFSEGSAAMMMVFTEHASPLWDRDSKSITGKIGYSAIPGGYSMLGGWGLAINRRSTRKKQAFEFLKWSCTPSIAVPGAALGRILPYEFIRHNAALNVQYPWLNEAFKSFDKTGRRYINAQHTITKGTIPDLERTIGRAVRSAVTGALSPEEALKKAAQEFAQLLKVSG